MSEESLKFSEGNSDKFWKIRLEGNSYTVNFGRVGTSGQTQTKAFASEDEAKKNYDKLVAEKLKKGYERSGQAVGTMPVASVIKDASIVVSKKEKEASANSAASSSVMTTAVLEKTDEIPAKSIVESAHEAPSPSDSARSASSSAATVSAFAPGSGSFKSMRKNDLKPEDFAFASWNPLPTLPEVKKRPFNFEKLCEDLKSIDPDIESFTSQFKKNCASPLHMSREEACFWIEAIIAGRQRIEVWGPNRGKVVEERRSIILKHLKSCDFSKERTVEELLTGCKLVAASNYGVLQMQDIARLICAHCSEPRKIIALALEMAPETAFQLMKVFRQYVMPALDSQTLSELHNYVRPLLSPKMAMTSPDAPAWTAYTVAAFLRMSVELEILVAEMPDGWLAHDLRNCFHPQLYILSLPSKEKVISEARRTKLYLGHGQTYYYAKRNPIDSMARAWLAVTGLDAPEILTDFIKANSYNKEAAESMIAQFKLIESAELSPIMIDLLGVDNARFPARKWLTEHSDWSIPYLYEACKGSDPIAKEAGDILQGVSSRLDESLYAPELVAAIRERFRLPDEGLEELDSSNAPAWLSAAIAEVKPGKTSLPIWSDPAVKPRIVIDKKRLNLDQMNAVLLALKQSTFEKIHPLIASIQEHLERKQTEKFAWALFESWLKNGADSKEKWAMGAIGFLGGDDTVFKIVPMIKVWPGESQHPRAVFGLECLRTIGSDTALMQINSLSQKLQFKGLKQKAGECMEAIAQSRGMSKNELEDRIIPDCGLDEKGQRVFDFGTRQFKFALGSDLKAMIREPDGKLKTDLPKPNSKDDAEKSKAAIDDWKLLKQQIKDIAKIQAIRLEQAMVTGRNWSVADFKKFLVHHPLMIHIVRMLIWGEFNDEGKLLRAFRVTEDHTYADEEDRDLELGDTSKIRVVHAMLLSEDLKAKWQGLLLDYEIVPPFKQLERPIFKLEAAENELLEITRFKDIQVPAVSMVGIFDRCGWRRGVPEDAGCFYSHSKFFPGAGVCVLATYQGVSVGYMMDSEPQSVESCFFFKADSDRVDIYFDARKINKIPLGKVDPIVISEVLHDLVLISAKVDTAE